MIVPSIKLSICIKMPVKEKFCCFFYFILCRSDSIVLVINGLNNREFSGRKDVT